MSGKNYSEKQILQTYIRHVEQAVQNAPDDFTKAIRLFVLGLAEAELARSGKEEGELLNTMNRIGLLYCRDHPSQPLTETISRANLAFHRNPHTAGLLPTECCVNPDNVSELPKQVEISDGNGSNLVLPVVADPLTRVDHVLLCLPDPDAEEQPEPAMELAYAE